MPHITEASTTAASFVEIQAVRAVSTSASTKDSGRVKVGGSGLPFAGALNTTKDTGRVKVGGSGLPF